MYFEKHCWLATLSAPQTSDLNYCENCVLSYCYSSYIERRIDGWQVSVVHLGTKSGQTHSLFILLYKIKLVLTLTEDIIIQSEPEKQDENQISEKKFWNLSNFQLKFSNAVDFETKFFTTRQILLSYFYNAYDFGLKKIQRVRFWIKKFTTRQILDQLFYNASIFELNFLLCVRFWVYFFCSLPIFPVFIITGRVSVMS